MATSQIPVYVKLAREIERLNRTEGDANMDAYSKICHLENLLNGNGIENASISTNNHNNIRVSFDYHFMDELGYYCGYLSCTFVIKPSLAFGYAYSLHLSAGNRRNYDLIKDSLEQEISGWLDTLVDRY